MNCRAAPDDLEIWHVDLDRDAAAVLRTGRERGFLSEVGAAAGDRPPAAQDDMARTCAHIALRLVLSRHVGDVRARAPFERSTGGKPLLAEGPAFSLSHSGRHALVAVAATGTVGIDVETHRRVRISADRRPPFEQAAIALADAALPADADGDARFLQAWTRIEAWAKATGEGMGSLLERLEVRPRREDAFGLRRTGAGVAAVDGLAVRDIALGTGIYAAVAATAAMLRGDPASFAVRRWTLAVGGATRLD